MLGEACALLAALTWSGSVVLFKRSETVSPQGMNLFKNVVALVLLAVTMPLFGVGIDWDRSSDDWWRLIVSGVLGIALADTLIFMALRRLGAAMLAVVECVYAPFIVTLSVIFLHEPLVSGFIIGAVLVVGGVLLATTDEIRDVDSDHSGRLTGAAFGVAGIAAMAIAVVMVKPALERGHLLEVTTHRLIAGVAGQLLWIALVKSQRDAFAAFKPSPAWRTLIPAAVLSSFVSMLLWLGAFKWASASTAAVLTQLSSVFTMVLAYFALRERLSKRRMIGGVFAIAGAFWVIATRG
jgi:drug/metabolite transporter (DMT)-like permease